MSVRNIALSAYPVGSIYMSINSTNPATLFGGTWERLKDRFLLASGDTYASGTTGGSATVNLNHSHTVNSHSHTYGLRYNTYYGDIGGADSGAMQLYNNGAWKDVGYAGSRNAWVNGGTTASSKSVSSSYASGTASTSASSPGTDSQLSSTSNNMPPYLAVYMWKRTA